MRVGRGIWLILVVGCATSAGEKTQVVELTCKHWPNQCYFRAQEKCRGGYNVLSKVESQRTGGQYGRYREYLVRVQCRILKDQ